MGSRLGKIYAGLLIRFNCGFNVAITIMVLYVGASVDEWNASKIIYLRSMLISHLKLKLYV